MEELPITAIVVLYYSKHLVTPLIANITKHISSLDEIILVDNSNEDLTEFENSLVKVIHPPKNLGYGAAINVGVKQARNEIIVAMNPDIEIIQWNTQMTLPQQNLFLVSGVPLEWSSIRNFPPLRYDILRISLQNLAQPFQWVNRLSGRVSLNNIESKKKVDWISGALIVTNKETMIMLGGFDEKYFLFYEELDLCKRAESLNISRHIDPNITFLLNQGTSSAFDVSRIKLASEIHSIRRYHTKYSGKIPTSCSLFLLKLFCYFVATSLRAFMIISKNPKLRKKHLQYAIYADAI